MQQSPDQDLLRLAEERFDQLLGDGRLFYRDSAVERVQHKGFDVSLSLPRTTPRKTLLTYPQFQFRVVPAFNAKPMPSVSGSLIGHKKERDPFGDPEEDFVLAQIKDTHLLQLNKFCTVRPQFILHTKEFASQNDDLDEADIAAAFDVLEKLGQPQVCFYNCGEESGASQQYKHMQLIPKPSGDEFVFFPDKPMLKGLTPGQDIKLPATALDVPYACLIAYPDHKGAATEIYAQYQDMLTQLQNHFGSIVAHNVIMTIDWVCVIPRQHRGQDGVFANSLGMMGMVWVKDAEERAGWEKFGMTEHLSAIGYPPILELGQKK